MKYVCWADSDDRDPGLLIRMIENEMKRLESKGLELIVFCDKFNVKRRINHYYFARLCSANELCHGITEFSCLGMDKIEITELIKHLQGKIRTPRRSYVKHH